MAKGSKLGEAYVEITGNKTKLDKTLKAAQTATLAFAAVAAAAIVAFNIKAVKAYGEHEVAVTKLQNTLDNMPQLAGETTAAFEKQADALQALTSQDDEAILTSQALLGQFKLTGDEIRGLTPLVSDLSLKMGIDMFAASKAVGKALDGNVGLLKRYGITVDEVAFKTDHYSAIQEALNRQVGGFGKEYGKTTEGSLKRVGRAFEELMETVGKGVAPAITDFADTISKLAASKEAQEFAEGLGKIFGDVAKALGDYTGSLIDNVGEIKKAYESLSPIQRKIIKYGTETAVGVGVTTAAYLKLKPILIGIGSGLATILGPTTVLIGALVGLGVSLETTAEKSNAVTASFLRTLEVIGGMPTMLGSMTENLWDTWGAFDKLNEAGYTWSDILFNQAGLGWKWNEILLMNRDRIIELANAINQTGLGIAAGVTSIDKFKIKADEAASATATLSQNINSVTSAIRGLTSDTSAAETANTALAEAEKATAEAVKKHGANSKEAKVAKEAENKVYGDAILAHADLKAKEEDLGFTSDELTGKIAAARQEYQDAISQGMIPFKTEMQYVIDKILEIPELKEIMIEADTSQADEALDGTLERLKNISKTWTAKVVAITGATGKVAEPSGLQEVIENAVNRITWGIGGLSVEGKQEGGPIPETGLYLMHKDEEVIPAEIAKRIPSYQAGTYGGISSGILATLSGAVRSALGVGGGISQAQISGIAGQINSLSASLYSTAKSGGLTDKSFDKMTKDLSLMSSAFSLAIRQIEKMNDQALDVMRARANELSDALDNAKLSLDYFASAPLIGMKAFDEQIFSTSEEIKSLQLRILKMKYAGTATEGEIDSFERQLSFLQMRSSMIDLEKDLQFDTLTKQIKEALLPATKELTFEEIIFGIQDAQAEIAVFQPALSQTQKQIESMEAANRAWADSMNEVMERMSLLSFDMLSLAAGGGGAAIAAAVDITSGAAAMLAKAGISTAQVAAMGYTRVGKLTAAEIIKGSKQTGGSIFETGLYKLHKGEFVVPPLDVEKMSLGGGESVVVNLQFNKALMFSDESSLRRVIEPMVIGAVRHAQTRTHGLKS